jgi:hypothetical protein
MRGWIAGGLLGLGLIAAGAASAQSVNIAGAWRIAGQIVVGNEFVSATPVCTFRQTGTRLSGTCIGPNATGPITGVVSGRAVSWTWSNQATTRIGLTGLTSFNGTYENSRLISGVMTSSASAGRGTFTQTR